MKLAAALAVVLAAAPARADDGDPPPAYHLNPEIDAPALAMASLTTTAWFFDLGPAYCAPQCDPKTLPAFDRPFAGRYHPSWTTAGTVTAIVILAAPVPVLLAVEKPRAALNDMVVVAESVMFASAAGVMFETGVRRPRPFLYGAAAPLSARMNTNASLSFFSGHTADSFAAAVVLSRTLDRLGVQRRWKWLATGAGLAGATFVAVSRVAAGDHFPSDVVVGAAVGTGFGMIVPALHDRAIAVTPMRLDDGWMVTAATRW